MRHFFTKDTEQAALWCGRCNKATMWRIAGGRPMYCIPCYERREDAREAAEPPSPLMDLFKGKD